MKMESMKMGCSLYSRSNRDLRRGAKMVHGNSHSSNLLGMQHFLSRKRLREREQRMASAAKSARGFERLVEALLRKAGIIYSYKPATPSKEYKSEVM